MNLTKNFTREEFDCSDGTIVPLLYKQNVIELAQNLQVLRDYLNEAIYVSSGFRTKKYNKQIGGVDDSQHLEAKAGDLSVKSLTPLQLAKTIEKLIAKGKMKQGGIGVYKTFVHYDIRGTKARW